MSDIEDHPTEPPPPSAHGTGETQRVPPIEAATMPPSREFTKTQPLPPLTAESVLEVVLLAHDKLLDRIDRRDANVLTVMRDIGSQMLSHYNEQREWIRELRNRTHRHSTRLQQFEIWMHEADVWMREAQKKFDLVPPPQLPPPLPTEPEPEQD